MTERFLLAQLPTPLEPLPRLSKALGGPRILVKRDDQTGLALGGNKTRKLEFLIADAIARRVDVVLTAGAAQSNHCRQTAAAAVKAGLPCMLILGGSEPEVAKGNLLIDRLLGADVYWTEREKRVERMEELAAELRAQGRSPYVIPYGGSNGMGAQGYVLAMQELMQQLKAAGEHPDTIVVASSSGGTQAGIVLGARLYGYNGTVLGVSIDKGERGPERYEVELAAIANAAAAAMGAGISLKAEDFLVEYGYLGGGYGVVGDLEREAIGLMARTEGIILDPVYTGRAFGALVDKIRRGEYGKGGKKSILFWHTGGAPACFAYEQDLRVAPGV